MLTQHEKWKAEAIAELERILKDDAWDVEVAHKDADAVLTTLLTNLGWSSVVELWRKVPKWYA